MCNEVLNVIQQLLESKGFRVSDVQGLNTKSEVETGLMIRRDKIIGWITIEDGWIKLSCHDGYVLDHTKSGHKYEYTVEFDLAIPNSIELFEQECQKL